MLESLSHRRLERGEHRVGHIGQPVVQGIRLTSEDEACHERASFVRTRRVEWRRRESNLTADLEQACFACYTAFSTPDLPEKRYHITW